MSAKCFRASLFVLALILAVNGLSQGPPELTLQLRELFPVVGSRSGSLLLPVKCSANGEIYMRGDAFPDTLAAPVIRISPDGKQTRVFALRSAPGMESSSFNDFAIDIGGNVYLLASRAESPTVARFDSEGTYLSTISPPAVVTAGQLAIFPSGEWLISGRKLDNKRSVIDEPITAIFEASGKLVAELRLPEDVSKSADPFEEADPNPFPSAKQTTEKAFRNALSLSQAVPAPDGNIYVLRPASPPLVYAIHPSGLVLRRLVLTPPADGARPNTLQVFGGRLYIEFAVPDAQRRYRQHVISVYDAETGETLVVYRAEPEAAGAFACYMPRGFIFIAAKAGQLVLKHAEPR